MAQAARRRSRSRHRFRLSQFWHRRRRRPAIGPAASRACGVPRRGLLLVQVPQVPGSFSEWIRLIDGSCFWLRPEDPKDVWSYYFEMIALQGGGKFRLLTSSTSLRGPVGDPGGAEAELHKRDRRSLRPVHPERCARVLPFPRQPEFIDSDTYADRSLSVAHATARRDPTNHETRRLTELPAAPAKQRSYPVNV